MIALIAGSSGVSIGITPFRVSGQTGPSGGGPKSKGGGGGGGGGGCGPSPGGGGQGGPSPGGGGQGGPSVGGGSHRSGLATWSTRKVSVGGKIDASPSSPQG